MDGSLLQLIVLVLMLGGGDQTDVVSFLPPRDYFHARKVKFSVDRMAELAAQEPTSPRAQVRQLLALRLLGEEADQLKRSPRYAAHRRTLEEIAAGKRAQDAVGFARDYATRTLARLDGKDLAAPPRGGSLSDGLDWFPRRARLLAMLRSHAPGAGVQKTRAPLLLRRSLPWQDRLKLFALVEQTGNFQVDRITLAVDGDRTWFVRVSGKANQRWIRAALQASGMRWTDQRTAADAPVAVSRTPDYAIVLVGNSDMLLVQTSQPRLSRIMDTALARRHQRPDDAALRELLRETPAEAIGFVVGRCEEEGGGPRKIEPRDPTSADPPAPEPGKPPTAFRIRGHMLRPARGLKVRADVVFETESQAEAAEVWINIMREEELKRGLVPQMLQANLGHGTEDKAMVWLPGFDTWAILKSLDQIRARADENRLRVRATLPEPTWLALVATYGKLLGGPRPEATIQPTPASGTGELVPLPGSVQPKP